MRANLKAGDFTGNQPLIDDPMSTETLSILSTTPNRMKKADVCVELGVSPRTLDNLVLRNEFPPGVRIGKWCYWSAKAIDNFRERAFKMQENWSPMASRRR